MTAASLLDRLSALGIHLRAEDDSIIARPRAALSDDLRAEIRAHKAELLALLVRVPERLRVPEPAHAGDAVPIPDPHASRPAPNRGAECMSCAHLTMRAEVHPGTRRVFWWRCERGHPMLEGRNFGERTLLAPPECDTAGDFAQWQAGQR